MKSILLKTRLTHKFYVTTILILTSLSSISQQAWTIVPSPDTSATRNILSGISGTSSSDVWAVGHFESTPAGNLRNLLMHWSGTGWQKYISTDLSATYNDLWDVTAITTNNVWAVGTYNEPGTTRSQLVHWNGSDWTHTLLPPITGGSFLFSIDAISANDIWAVGGKAGSPTRPGYTIHYDGSNWTEYSAASPGSFRNYFNAVDGFTSNDVWAVGYLSNAYGDFHAMAQHWNGSNWTNFSLPSSVSSPLGELLSVTMISSNDVWAIGSTITGVMMLIHWDGSSWTEISSTGAAGGTIVARGADVFAVGDKISQRNGSSWNVIDPLSQLSYPTLVSAVSFSNGDIWACGRTFDTSFHSLVYRTANATPTFVHGGTQVLNAGQSAQNIDEFLKVQDADVSQVVTYSLITPPSHGTVTELPDTAITNNGFAIPSGVSYLRDNGYTGSDQFVVKASVGPLSSLTTINITPLSPLPVLLGNYSVTRTGKTATIEWTTATEINSKEFIIERSADGINFGRLGQVATHGTASTYKFIDPSPVVGWNYYRLKQVDLDGRETIFPVKSLKFESVDLKPFIVYQNPVVNKVLRIRSNMTGESILSLFNQQGQKLMTKLVSNTSSLIHLPLPGNLPAGIYTITLTNKKESWSEKIVIE